jgi:hypothetical protein
MTHIGLAKQMIVAFSLIIAGFPVVLQAQEAKDPAGTWEIRFSRPGRPPSVSILKLEKAGDKYVGAVTSEQGQTVPIKDVQWKDGELSFGVTFERQGQEFKLAYKGKVTGDAIKGQVSLNILGQKRSVDFEGNRKNEVPTLAGLWKVNLQLASGVKLQPSVRLKQQGRRWTGSYIGISGKETPLQEVKSTGTDVSFRVTDELEGEKVAFRYSAKLAGEQLAGTVEIGEGNQVDKRKFDAQRVHIPTANIAGDWELTVSYEKGTTFDPTVKLAQTGSSLTGTYVGEHGETPITDGLVLGDEVMFTVACNRDGKKYKLKYTGKVTHDAIQGGVDYDFDGMIGFLPFEGKRLPDSKSNGKN